MLSKAIRITCYWIAVAVCITLAHSGANAQSAANGVIASSDGAHVVNAKSDTNTTSFDFDTGTPILSVGQSTPFSQTSGGLTGSFSSPTVGAGGFSIQTDSSTQFHMSKFSGNYLYPNSVYSPALNIAFDRPLTGISFTFATADFQQVEVPTTIKLTAYQGSTATTPIGSKTAHGRYGGDTMPMGTLTFSSTTPFDVVEINIPPAPLAASDFLADNFIVTYEATPTCTTKPAKPVPASPAAGAISKTRSVNLSWNSANCATFYKVVVRLGSKKGTNVDGTSKIKGTDFTSIALTRTKTYYWRVSACNKYGCAGSDWWYFKIGKKAN